MTAPAGAPPLASEERGGVLVLTFDRPERRNPLGHALRGELARALDEGVARGTKVVLLRSRPWTSPVFAAGADLREIGALGPSQAAGFAARGQALFRQVEDLPAVVIAAVDGPCRGGALDLVLACDVVACTPRATFAHPGLRLGIVTGWGGTRRLPRAVGPGPAAALLVSGRVLAGPEAARRGLARRCLPQEGFDEAARRLAEDWARLLEPVSPAAVRRVKRLLELPEGADRAEARGAELHARTVTE